jgi:membrane glycosyltransferase
VLASALVESVFATLIAPVMMLLHAYFVITVLCGHTVAWNPQTREGRSIGLQETARYLLIPTLIGVVWGAVTFSLAPSFFWWLTPVLLGLGLAIPVILWSSRSSVGQRLKRLGLLSTPEELTPPVELREALDAYEALGNALLLSSSSTSLPTPLEIRGEMQPQSIEPFFSWSPRERWGVSRITP